MTPFKDLSIKSKLTWLVMLTSGFALLIAGTAFVAHELLTFRRAMVLELSTLADAIGQTASSSLRLNATNYAAITLASLSAQKQIIAAAFFKGGKIFATFPNDRDPASFPENVTGESHRFGRNSLTVIRPVLDPDNSPLATIYIQSSLEQMYSRLRRDVGIVLGVMLAASIVAWVTSARLQGVISKPILHLSHTARSVSEKNRFAEIINQLQDASILTISDSEGFLQKNGMIFVFITEKSEVTGGLGWDINVPAMKRARLQIDPFFIEKARKPER